MAETPASFGTETQNQSAQRMYNARAPKYEDSWHPAYSESFIASVPLKPGDRVLDLCCGTGLEAFLAAATVGEDGEIIGVDVSGGMLEQLRGRQLREPGLGRRIKALHHDVTDLGALAAVEKGSFDAVLCSCAFVLFDDPAGVMAHWREYLRPGGLMAIDIPGEHNLRPGLVLEQVAKGLGMNYPSNRSYITSSDDFGQFINEQGMEMEGMITLYRMSGKGSVFYGADEADERFEEVVNSSLTQNAVLDDFKAKAKPLFREEWERIAVDGKVESTDISYIYIARKPELVS
ncbi:Demethylmenaquinone methyltransferase [Cytospora mali]|uniref:Demethylmenaquinone methyltransferase n=1 Tax=Cytospora mali TaxID=578113 RepID=A0A194VG98_CYTMA|nr:Demethylmenaquinone methyltransferase [Valsa mali var. pyri (nom. inval.)]